MPQYESAPHLLSITREKKRDRETLTLRDRGKLLRYPQNNHYRCVDLATFCFRFCFFGNEC